MSGAKPSTVSVVERRAGPLRLDARERFAADEIALVERDRKAEPGLIGVGVGRDVRRPVDVALLEPQRFDGAVAGVGDAVCFAGRAISRS